MTTPVPAGFALMLAVALAGCGPSVTIRDEALRRAAPKTIAVIPFTAGSAPTGDLGERAELKLAALRAAVEQRVSTLSYLRLSPGDTDRRLARAGLRERAALALATPRRIGEVLDVDAVLACDAISFSSVHAGIVHRSAIGARVRLVDARSGADLAVIDHTESDIGGLLVGSGQLVDAIREGTEVGTDRGFAILAGRFADRVVQALPVPAAAPAVRAPRVDRVEVTGGEGGVLRAGDAVEARVLAARGLRVSLDLGRGVAEVPLVEVGPGEYRGFYRVAPGDRSEGAVRIQASDRYGVTAARTARPMIRIDAPGA